MGRKVHTILVSHEVNSPKFLTLNSKSNIPSGHIKNPPDYILLVLKSLHKQYDLFFSSIKVSQASKSKLLIFCPGRDLPDIQKEIYKITRTNPIDYQLISLPKLLPDSLVPRFVQKKLQILKLISPTNPKKFRYSIIPAIFLIAILIITLLTVSTCMRQALALSESKSKACYSVVNAVETYLTKLADTLNIKYPTIISRPLALIQTTRSLGVFRDEIGGVVASVLKPGLPPPNIIRTQTLFEEISQKVYLDLLAQPLPRYAVTDQKKQFDLLSIEWNILAHVKKFESLLPEINSLLSTSSCIDGVILVLDSSQARPSGGTVQALITFTLSQGRLSQIRVHSADSLDRQMSGIPDSPADFTKRTPTSRLSLGNSLWGSSFLQSAQAASWFISRELKFQPELVIAIETSTLSQILADIGLENPKLTASSPEAKSQLFTQITTSAIDKLRTLSPGQLGFVAQNFFILAANHQALITSISPTLPLPILASWADPIVSPTQDVFYPTLTFTQAINSKPVLNQKVTVEFQADQTTYLLDFDIPQIPDQSATSILFRLQLPTSAVIDDLEINGQKLLDSSYSLLSQPGFQEISLDLDSVTKSATLIKINVHSKRKLTNYTLVIPRQPGVTSVQDIEIKYPPEITLSAVQPPSFAKPGILRYNNPTFSQVELGFQTPLP